MVIPTNINITTEAGESFGLASWDIPTVSDNSGNFTLNSTHQPGDMFDIGPTTVTYTLTDAAGNTVTASFMVFVRGMYRFTTAIFPVKFYRFRPLGGATIYRFSKMAIHKDF